VSDGGLRVAQAPDAAPVHPLPPTPPPPAPERALSNLALRLLTAAVLIPTVVAMIFAGSTWVLGTVVVVTLLGLHEFYGLIEQKGAEPLRGFGLVAGTALPVVAFFGNEYHATVIMTAVLLAMMVGQLGKAQIGQALASISGTFFGVFYVGWLLSHAVVLREFHRILASKYGEAVVADMHPDVGGFYLFFVISVVVAGDAGAYFAGHAWGRRKLAPRISPGKTVEGALGGAAAGIVMALALKLGFDLAAPALSAHLGFWAAGLLGLVLAVVGLVGDLVESLLKRDAHVKDAGRSLPGMGGVLDRIDSNLLAIPVMYYLLLAYTYLQQGRLG
jgi:phosphatidate cytidylyltransferase